MIAPPPKVSIIIPVYNAELCLQDCLNSAIHQTLKDIEIVCVDDASSDDSPAILAESASNDARIRVITHEENQGEGAARNTGIDNARGDYIFHLDADDSIPPDAIEKLFAEASCHNSDMVKGGFIMIYDGDKVDTNVYGIPHKKLVNTNIQESRFLQNIPTSHCSYLYKRQFLNQYDIRYRTDLSVGLDLVALATALIHAGTVTLITDVVYRYYQSSTSAIRGKLSLKAALDAIRSKMIVSEMLSEINMDEIAKIRLKNWNFIISTYWRRMPGNLSTSECDQVFSLFRTVISNYTVKPWQHGTPQHYKYILALILAKQDEDALLFLSNEDSSRGFSDTNALKTSLQFILQQFPEDSGSLMDLGRILLSENNPKEAITLFGTVIQNNPKHFDARLMTATAMSLTGRHEEAQKMLDTALQNLNLGRNMLKQVHLLVDKKKEIDQVRNLEISDNLRKTQAELKHVRDELESVYKSYSWRFTHPFRRLKHKL